MDNGSLSSELGKVRPLVSEANEKYSEARRQVSVRNMDVLMNAQSPQWWSTLKSVSFGSSSSFPPFVGEGGGLVSESVGKGADTIATLPDYALSTLKVFPLPLNTKAISASFPDVCNTPTIVSGVNYY